MAREETSNQREISAAINNAVAAALRPARLGPIPEARLKKLHAVAKALISPAQELSLIHIFDSLPVADKGRDSGTIRLGWSPGVDLFEDFLSRRRDPQAGSDGVSCPQVSTALQTNKRRNGFVSNWNRSAKCRAYLQAIR